MGNGAWALAAASHLAEGRRVSPLNQGLVSKEFSFV